MYTKSALLTTIVISLFGLVLFGISVFVAVSINKPQNTNKTSAASEGKFLNCCGYSIGQCPASGSSCPAKVCTGTVCRAQLGQYIKRFVCDGVDPNCYKNYIILNARVVNTSIDAKNESCNRTVQLNVYDAFDNLIDFIIYYTGEC